VPSVSRNPFAYPLAPFLGFASQGGGAGSVLVVFAVVGIMAAVAIPNFIKFQERMRAATAAKQTQMQRQMESEGKARVSPALR